MAEPRDEARNYLKRACPGAKVTPIAGDASTRRFYRVALPGGKTRVLMDYGEPFEGETEDVVLNRVFRAAGLPVAEVLDRSGEAGCLLLEDLGDRLLEGALLSAPRNEARRLLETAVDLAAEVAGRGTPALRASERADGPALDPARFRFEMDFFLEHWAAGLLGRADAPGALRNSLYSLADSAAKTPSPVLCHRDFHSRNLMLLDDGGLAMVDIQDARWGPDSYDLASLLRDAYAEVNEGWLDGLIERYLGRLTDPPDPERFRRRFERVAHQRMIKALGTFGYQTAVRGSDRYLDAARRTVDRLRTASPASAELRRLGEELERAGLLVDPPDRS
jgi:aminoglycoside/choline kinase family phosphotransferase